MLSIYLIFFFSTHCSLEGLIELKEITNKMESVTCKIEIEESNLEEIEIEDIQPQIEAQNEIIHHNCIKKETEETEFVEVKRNHAMFENEDCALEIQSRLCPGKMEDPLLLNNSKSKNESDEKALNVKKDQFHSEVDRSKLKDDCDF